MAGHIGEADVTESISMRAFKDKSKASPKNGQSPQLGGGAKSTPSKGKKGGKNSSSKGNSKTKAEKGKDKDEGKASKGRGRGRGKGRK